MNHLLCRHRWLSVAAVVFLMGCGNDDAPPRDDDPPVGELTPSNPTTTQTTAESTTTSTTGQASPDTSINSDSIRDHDAQAPQLLVLVGDNRVAQSHEDLLLDSIEFLDLPIMIERVRTTSEYQALTARAAPTLVVVLPDGPSSEADFVGVDLVIFGLAEPYWYPPCGTLGWWVDVVGNAYASEGIEDGDQYVLDGCDVPLDALLELVLDDTPTIG